jgi:DNA polymerase-3 subunit epsilon
MLEAERAKVTLTNGQSLVDPLLLDRWLDKYRKGSRKLVDVAHRWGVELSQAHAADADAIAAAQTARAIALHWGPTRDRHTSAFRQSDLLFPGARRYQAELYLKWRDDVNAYWERSGAKETDGTPRRATGTWPCGALNPLATPAPEPDHV